MELLVTAQNFQPLNFLGRPNFRVLRSPYWGDVPHFMSSSVFHAIGSVPIIEYVLRESHIEGICSIGGSVDTLGTPL